MAEVKVEKWVNYEDVADDMKESCGGTGGWVDGHKWRQYIVEYPDAEQPYLEAIRADVVANNLRITGDQHQHFGATPVFSDGTWGNFSMRAWGDLMAAIWNTAEDTYKYSYMSFYM